MENKITKGDIVDFLKEGSKFLGTLALKVYGESLNQVGEQAFSEAIEIGIKNTIAALYDGKVRDEDILRIVNEHWGISVQEVEDRLIWEKQEATIRTLKQYLKLQGYSQVEIDSFMKNVAFAKIRKNKELWKLKDNPEKLLKAIKTTVKK